MKNPPTPSIRVHSTIETLPIDTLVPYARNSRTHSPEQVAQIAASIREFGFTNPVLIDDAGGIIAGHGRVLGARAVGLAEVPCLRLAGLSDAQKRAYVIADNKLALNAGWDDALLALEMRDLQGLGFDMNLLGFNAEDIDSLISGVDESPEDIEEESIYSKKIKSPIYEIKGDRPEAQDLYDETKTNQLIRQIDAEQLPEEIAIFLKAAAQRHTVFNFRNIAEFYARASAPVQNLMEKSALVIIDFDKAIENGFVALTARLGEIADQEGWNTNDA